MATLTDSQLTLAKALRVDGHTWEEIGKTFGVSRGTIRRAVCPEYREREKSYKRRWRAGFALEKVRPVPLRCYVEGVELPDREYHQSDDRRKRILDRENSIQSRLASRLRTRLWKAIKGQSHVRGLGCTIEELAEWLELQFHDHPRTGEAMTWDNWGPDGWHIDHVLPLASFDLTDSEQLKEACSFWNLQPLWAEFNLSKGAIYEY